MTRISVIGLGKLGACTAAALASRGFDVVGVDINETTVAAINQGSAPVQEPNLQEILDRFGAHLRATTSYAEAVQSTDVTFIVVQTPTDENGGFSLDYAKAAAAEVGRALAKKDSYHLVIMTSTVLPGATEREIIPVLERFSGKRCGREFGLCYSPEFIALGSVIHDFLNPDMVLIGEVDSRSGELLSSVYKQACENEPSIQRMNVVNAEIVKLAVNTFVTTKISFANMMAELCGQVPGADVDVVTNAMGEDTRIGRKYLTGGLSFGGPCFPRDNVALAYLARLTGANGGLAEATHEYNLHHLDWVLEHVYGTTSAGDTVSVVGLSYRPDTPVIERSAAMYLVTNLVESGRRVTVYDDHALEPARRVLGDSVTYASSVQACLGADVVVLTDTSGTARSLTSRDFTRHDGKTTVVLDCWRVCPPDVALSPWVSYVGLGRGTSEEHGAGAEAVAS